MGEVELATPDGWQPLTDPRSRLAAGSRVRTKAAGRLALTLGGGESLRLAAQTEVMLDAPGRLYVQAGTIYVDSGERPSPSRIEVVTPAGTARDLGTQFELHIEGAALRLRVREGLVMLDRGGRSLTGRAGEQLTIDGLGGVTRASISPTDPAWHWAEAVASMPDMDGKPASALIAWVARETGRRLQYESPFVEQRAAAVILHGEIRHLAPLEALEAMLATTDLDGRAEWRYHGDPVPNGRSALIVRNLAFLLVPLAAAAEAADYRGAQVEAVLESLRSGGVEILYSSDLVKPWMRVEQEPRATEPRALLAEILSRHGIAVADGPGDSLMLVRERAARAATCRTRVAAQPRAGPDRGGRRQREPLPVRRRALAAAGRAGLGRTGIAAGYRGGPGSGHRAAAGRGRPGLHEPLPPARRHGRRRRSSGTTTCGSTTRTT